MDRETKRILAEIRERYDGCGERYDYGTSSSGNWGHVGRPGEVGGSQSGGGAGFMLERTNTRSTSTKKYTSRAKLHKEGRKSLNKAKAAVKKAEKSGSAKDKYRANRALERAEKHMSKLNDKQKTADAAKQMLHPDKYSYVPTRAATEAEKAAGKGNYIVTNTKASSDRQSNDKTARISDVTKAKGPERTVRAAVPGGTVRGGNKSRGGTTEEKTRKK